MARVIMKLDAGTPVHIEGLCPKCWCSTLWSVSIYRLTTSGVALFAEWRGCSECRERITS